MAIITDEPITRMSGLQIIGSGTASNGFYTPQLTQAQINAIPVDEVQIGGIIYNSDMQELQYFAPTLQWVNISSDDGEPTFSTLTVTGIATLGYLVVNNNVLVGNNLNVTNAATVNQLNVASTAGIGTLNVTGATTLNTLAVGSTLGVTGATTLSGTLNVAGATTLNTLVINSSMLAFSAGVATDLNVGGTIYGRRASASIYGTSGSTFNITGGTYTLIPITTTLLNANHFTMPSQNRLQYTGSNPITILINAFFACNGNTNSTVGISIYKNGSIIAPPSSITFNSSTFYTLPLTMTLSLTTNDYIELWVYTTNTQTFGAGCTVSIAVNAI
jgi:hypothetical protein